MTTATRAPAELHALGQRRRMAILATCCLSLLIVGIDLLAVNVALPAIAHDLKATSAQLQWVIDAYSVVIASLLILSGSIADRVGRRRVFQIGLLCFGAGSLACSLAWTPGLLIGARMLQAVGGSMLNPVAMAIITNTFTDPRERAKAIGIWGGVVGFSMALGPVVGGALVSAAGWRSIFWINIPVVVVAVVLAGVLVPESRAARARAFDPAGQVLMIVLLAATTFGIIEGRELGWSAPVVLGCFVAAALALVVFLLVETRLTAPLIDPRFFRSVPFSAAVVSAILGFASMGGFLFLNTLYLQQVRGFSALHAGLMTLPMAAATAVCSPLSGRLVAHRGPRTSMLLAGTFIAVSGVVLAQLTASSSALLLAGAYLCFGLGFGVLNAPITNAAVAGMPLSQAGVAAAVASTSRQVGAALGVAILGAVALGGLSGPIHDGLPAATHPAWWLMAGFGVLLVVVGFTATTPWAMRTAGRVAAGA